MMDETVRDWLRRTSQRLMMLLGVGRVAACDDSQSLQFIQAQMNADEVIDALQRVADFGFTSRPPVGSEVLVAFLSGDRSKGMVIGTMHQPSRLRGLSEGESALYSQKGQKVWLAIDGIHVNGAGLPVFVENAQSVDIQSATTVTITAPSGMTITTPLLTVTGNIQGATVTGTTDVIAGTKSGKTHVHGGVTTGVSTTAQPT